MADRIENFICTSVEDVKSSLHFITGKEELEFLENVIRYELQHSNRITIIKLLKAKIRQLEKREDEPCPGI